MLKGLGETELEIGEIGAEESFYKKAPREREPEELSLEEAGAEGEEAEEKLGLEEMLSEIREPSLEQESMKETPSVSIQPEDLYAEEEPAPQGGEKEGEDDLTSLLKDIEIGLYEERELEEKFKREEEGLSGAGEAEEKEAQAVPEEVAEGITEEAGFPEAVVEEKEEEGVSAESEEEGFDLPSDFDMSNLGVLEGPPDELMGRAEEQKEEFEEVSEEEAEEAFEVPGLEELEGLEGVGEAAEEEYGLEGVEQAGEEPEAEVPELSEGLPEFEELEEETEVTQVPESGEEFAIAGHEEGEVETGAGEPFEAEVEKALPEEEAAYEAGPAPGAEMDIVLSDEDIVLIKTKMRQLSPHVASVARDIIVQATISMPQMKQLLELLIRDAPEAEIVQFIERETGKRVLPVRRVEAPPVEKPRRLTAFAENVGPLIRVTGLFISVIVLLGAMFMVFLYKPIKSIRYYKEGLEYIRNENYIDAEKSFDYATNIYPKVNEYDNYGFAYLMFGNYDAAEKKLEQGINLDDGVKNLLIREHLALLYNVLQKYERAEELYDVLIENDPRLYRYKKLKGQNLIDWGKEEESRLEEAYTLFEEEAANNSRNSDPIFRMLQIDLLRRDAPNTNYHYEVLQRRFPEDVDREVYTELGTYYIEIGQLAPVWDIMSSVISRFPDYPPAYYIFSLYNKEVNNKSAEENLLRTAIETEEKRELQFPWETRDRELLSNARNNLGELYARTELVGKSAEAIRQFKEAIEINENNTKAYFNLAQEYFYKERNYEFARRYYEKAKSLGFENNDLSYNLGLLYYYERDFNKAVKQWSSLAEVMPSNPNVNFAIGSALLHMGKYNAALGEFLLLSEMYKSLVAELGEIKPWSVYHKRLVLGAASVYNNLGVACQRLFEQNGNPEYQRESLVYLYKAGELADIIGTDWGVIQYNINYIIHPDVIRGGMAINDDIKDDYRFDLR